MLFSYLGVPCKKFDDGSGNNFVARSANFLAAQNTKVKETRPSKLSSTTYETRLSLVINLKL